MVFFVFSFFYISFKFPTHFKKSLSVYPTMHKQTIVDLTSTMYCIQILELICELMHIKGLFLGENKILEVFFKSHKFVLNSHTHLWFSRMHNSDVLEWGNYKTVLCKRESLFYHLSFIKCFVWTHNTCGIIVILSS